MSRPPAGCVLFGDFVEGIWAALRMYFLLLSAVSNYGSGSHIDLFWQKSPVELITIVSRPSGMSTFFGVFVTVIKMRAWGPLEQRRSAGERGGGWRLRLVAVADSGAADRSVGSDSARAAVPGSLAGLPRFFPVGGPWRARL